MIKMKYNNRHVGPSGGIGRHKGLKIPRRQLRAGSSPASGTIVDKFNKKSKIPIPRYK